MSENTPRTKKALLRFTEVLPGLFTWIIVLSPIWGGLFIPEQYAYFIIFFTVFMLYKSISMTVFYVIAYFRIKEAENTNWYEKLQFLDDSPSAISLLRKEIDQIKGLTRNMILADKTEKRDESYTRNFIYKFTHLPELLQKLLFRIKKIQLIRFLKNEIKELKEASTKERLDWKELKHIVITPFVQEGYNVLKPPVEQLANQTLPAREHIVLVLATEARKPEGKKVADQLKAEYQSEFMDIWITEHEVNFAVDEIVGKGSNMHYAARVVEQKIEENGWDNDQIVISSMDCDSQFDLKYFAALTYSFILEPKRYRKIFHAPMNYYANYWKVPFFVRIANTMFSIGSTSMAARPDKYKPVSTYSASFNLLESIGFWSPDIIPEDYHTFFKALFLHGDDVSVVPIYLRTLGDAAADATYTKSAVNQYEQVKRWAWGMSDLGWMFGAFYYSKHKSLYMIYHMLQAIITWTLWSTASFLLFFGANIPPVIDRWVGDGRFGNDILGLSLGRVSSTILTISIIIFLFVVFLDLSMRPKRPKQVSLLRDLAEQVLWFLMPVISIIFGSLPGLDAQTRLLFGKYLEYRVTEKGNE